MLSCELVGSKADAIGNTALLARHKIGLLCSRHCPAGVIVDACDRFREWADLSEVTIVSAFHSPVERECLRLLLKGVASMIVCPAREIRHMRIPADWQTALDAGRLLVVSPFSKRRANIPDVDQRNRLVATLADTLYIPYAGPNGRLATLETVKHAPHI